ncbi:MAG: HEAT repeat domain-containing protein [Candidatus Thorarchaeota archaeon]
MEGTEPFVRTRGAASLCLLRVWDAIEVLERAMQNPNSDERKSIVESLTGIDDNRSLDIIPRALTDSNRKVRRAAKKALQI